MLGRGSVKFGIRHSEEPRVMGVTATDGRQPVLVHDFGGFPVAPKGQRIAVVNGLNPIKWNFMDDFDGFGMFGIFSGIDVKGVRQDGDSTLLVDELDSAFGGQPGRYEFLEK